MTNGHTIAVASIIKLASLLFCIPLELAEIYTLR